MDLVKWLHYFSEVDGMSDTHYTDEYIYSNIKEIGATGYAAHPARCYGDWKIPPYEDIMVEQQHYALIFEDEMTYGIVVNRTSGAVKIAHFDEELVELFGEAVLVNSSLEQFYQFCVLWGKLLVMTENVSDNERVRIVSQTKIAMQTIDKAALENEDWGAWPTSLEELRTGAI